MRNTKISTDCAYLSTRIAGSRAHAIALRLASPTSKAVPSGEMNVRCCGQWIMRIFDPIHESISILKIYQIILVLNYLTFDSSSTLAVLPQRKSAEVF